MRRTVLAVALGSLLVATACSSSASGSRTALAAPKPGATVPMVFTEFKPTMFTIKAGQALTFVNHQSITHEIVGGSYQVDAGTGLRTSETDDKTFDLKVSQKGDTVEHVYDQPGTYHFFCTIHKGMNGTVVVQ
ncbi:MAG: plastocyanin/azurin family copper-binding protein [Mycobacteriales bacterium]